MRSWSLSQGDAYTLTLSADARLGQVNYLDDLIWQLGLKGGESTALVLHSSLGLRARWIKLFPVFTRKNQTAVDPEHFIQQPTVQAVFPNYARVAFYPFEGVSVHCEYWIPGSNLAAGRISLHQRSGKNEKLGLEWHALLNPLVDGELMSPITRGGQSYLKGRCANLVTVCMLNGQPRVGSSTQPALKVDVELGLGSKQSFIWALAAHTDEQQALPLAQGLLKRRWDAEIARVETVNESQLVEFHTHDEDWDSVLDQSQKAAYRLFYSGSQHLRHASFMQCREPDHGYSLRGDGSDYPMVWKGQTALDAFALGNVILPGGAELLKGVIRNFLTGQEVNGSVQWRPNLMGSKSNRLAQPLLATLAWKIFTAEGNLAWLDEVFAALLNLTRVWFNAEHDQDGDGYPEWEHPLQTGLEDLPLFDRWHPQSQGVEISLLECPQLGSFLFQELESLKLMAQALDLENVQPWIDSAREDLRRALMESFSAKRGGFSYRDAFTHHTTGSKTVGSFLGVGRFPCGKQFSSAQRLQLTYTPITQATRPLTVRINGDNGEEEVIHARDWHWSSGKASATSRHLFASVREVDVDGVSSEDRVLVSTIDYTQEDISLLFPLWAGIPSPHQAQRLVKETLFKAYTFPFGVPTCLLQNCPEDVLSLNKVSVVWNTLLLDGLLRYGFRDEAADLFGRMMDAMTQNLQQQNAFYEFYDPNNGAGFGERNHLRGLAPASLLLRILGIDKISAREIIVSDFNPFPWPITVKYHGVEIQSHPTHAVVTFPNGQSACLIGAGPHQVTLKPTTPENPPPAVALTAVG